MRNEADLLLEDLESIRSNVGTVAPDHPKVKKWVAEIRDFLAHKGNKKGLKEFEQLEFVKRGAEMWSQYVVTQGAIRGFKADLDKVEEILEKTGARSKAPDDGSSADQRIRELFFTSTEEGTQDETQVESLIESLVEKTLVATDDKGKGQVFQASPDLGGMMDQKIDPSYNLVTKQHLSASAREEAVDQLMADLSAEMKSSNPDWKKVQKVMGDMMGLKKTGRRAS